MEQHLPPAAASARGLTLAGVAKSYGPVPAVRGIDVTVEPGTMVSLIGPSGCGKTTTLRMIAGLERPTAGRIVAGDMVLSDGASMVPPERRDMGMVFQTYALWPHMTVARNVAYGLKRKGLDAKGVVKRVSDTLALVGLSGLEARYPSQLSGGQQQRVALARAIASEPSILLFDEPLSNLDAQLREQMRFEIRSLQQRLGTTSVYVTHSQEEALALSDRIVVMRAGEIAQIGTPQDLYERPRTAFVAGFIGLANILELTGVSREGPALRGRLASGAALTAAAGALASHGDTVRVCVRPADLVIRPANAQQGGPNRLTGVVTSRVMTGSVVDTFVALDGATDTTLRVQSLPPFPAEVGVPVALDVSPDRTVALED